MRREEAIKMITKTRPYPLDKLYRFRAFDLNRLESFFNKREIYFPNPTQFNDPFESKPILKLHNSRLKRDKFLIDLLKEKHPEFDKRGRRRFLKKHRRNIPFLTSQNGIMHVYENFLKATGILSLSEKNDDILMWAHYADSHQGICLEFDAATEGTFFWESFKVIYQDEYPTVNIMAIGQGEEYTKALLTKSTHWEYEQEWRIIKCEEDGGPGVHHFDPKLLTGIILGARINEKNKLQLFEWVDNFPTKIKLFQAELSGKRFALDFVEL